MSYSQYAKLANSILILSFISIFFFINSAYACFEEDYAYATCVHPVEGPPPGMGVPTTGWESASYYTCCTKSNTMLCDTRKWYRTSSEKSSSCPDGFKRKTNCKSNDDIYEKGKSGEFNYNISDHFGTELDRACKNLGGNLYKFKSN